MFIHNFKYTIITLFKNKALIFWTFAFPILLVTFFNMAFSDIEKNEQLKVIDIAIVENDEFKNNEIFKETFKILSDENSKEQLFNTKYVEEAVAKKLLENNKISGYLLLEDTPLVFVNKSGSDETILKYVTEEILQREKIFKNIYTENNSFLSTDIYNEVLKILEEDSNIENISSNNLSYTVIEFYSLVAMAALYGGILSMFALNKALPNMSNNGKRVAVSSISKRKLILSSMLASYITQLIGILLLFIYTTFVIKVDYGKNILLIILLSITGCFAGLSLGVAVSSIFKVSENTKTGIIISITMLFSYLSGMMGITMKYVIDKNIPIINKINPVSMITDGFYSLYYYDTLDRYYFNVISLLIFAFVMILLSIFSLRRQKYDSI